MCLSPCSIMNTWAYIGEVPTKTCLVESGRSSGIAPNSIVSSESAYASPDYVATIKRFARQAGFSSKVATQLPFFRRKFKRVNYQARWSECGMPKSVFDSPHFPFPNLLNSSPFVQAQRNCPLYRQRV